MHLTYVDRLSPFAFGHLRLAGHEVGIRWYGLAYLLGFAFMYLFYRLAAQRQEIAGFGDAEVDNLAIRIVAGVMIGGRLGFVVQHPVELFHHPLFLISIWNGGMAFFGGLAGVILAVGSFSYQHHIPLLALSDVVAPPAALSLGIGRIANFVNGELYGRPTHAGWGVIFPNVDYQPRHPSQLYESAAHLVLFLVLLLLARRRRSEGASGPPGAISWCFLIGYGILRLVTDFWRQDDVYWGPLSDGQWFSLGIAVAGVVAFMIWMRRTKASTAKVRPVNAKGKKEE